MNKPLSLGVAGSAGDDRVEGQARSDDGPLDLSLAVPEEKGGPVARPTDAGRRMHFE
ncbi:hypothetical protein GCM10022222_55530 [Amycolatopsis ultiminotia]|uniref:Uncharacterized protein n=1 Tax=Amycolatopsis ultiminotia TaxID=543629 RepID=A0ABP6XCU1_9PSEU